MGGCREERLRCRDICFVDHCIVSVIRFLAVTLQECPPGRLILTVKSREALKVADAILHRPMRICLRWIIAPGQKLGWELPLAIEGETRQAVHNDEL